jgi:hypothetical protein
MPFDDLEQRRIRKYKKEINRYTFYCSGHHHKNLDLPENYPQYNSTDGLIQR